MSQRKEKMATPNGTAVDNNHFWRFNYPTSGYIFDLRKRRFALYRKDYTGNDETLARFLVTDLMFFPKRIETLDWKSEKEILNP